MAANEEGLDLDLEDEEPNSRAQRVGEVEIVSTGEPVVPGSRQAGTAVTSTTPPAPPTRTGKKDPPKGKKPKGEKAQSSKGEAKLPAPPPALREAHGQKPVLVTKSQPKVDEPLARIPLPPIPKRARVDSPPATRQSLLSEPFPRRPSPPPATPVLIQRTFFQMPEQAALTQPLGQPILIQNLWYRIPAWLKESLVETGKPPLSHEEETADSELVAVVDDPHNLQQNGLILAEGELLEDGEIVEADEIIQVAEVLPARQPLRGQSRLIPKWNRKRAHEQYQPRARTAPVSVPRRQASTSTTLAAENRALKQQLQQLRGLMQVQQQPPPPRRVHRPRRVWVQP